MAKSEIDRVMNALRVKTEASVAGMVLDIHGDLVEVTPVKTGWARNNWLLALGHSAPGPIGTPENVNTTAKDAGIPSVLGWKISDGPIYITNNVPYIGRLNGGSSKQAPRGFIEKAVTSAVRKRANGSL
jgi:hypothetical protein